jgi:hypothetical protein
MVLKLICRKRKRLPSLNLVATTAEGRTARRAHQAKRLKPKKKNSLRRQ